ncbi:MAG TPA: isochorismatase family cysteine hydrolase [Acidimicrobiales bacterium]|jgi:nicotinamidase-related amidase|nr:isochorismatase family cysteine hydrolase [Acidimicrobiales bacterium]
MHPLGPGPRNAWRVDGSRCDLRRRPVAGWEVAAVPQALVLDPDRTGIMVVDMQNDFCHPGGWLASIGVDIGPTRPPIATLQSLLPTLRTAGVPVVWLGWGNRADRANLPPGVMHVYNPDGTSTGIGDDLSGAGPVLQSGSWGAAIVDELAPEAGDIEVAKYRMSGFWDTQLDTILRNLDLTTVLFAGVNADQCVLATLIDAACVGYDCIMVTDCCATTSPSYCWDATLYNVKQCFGFVTTSEALRQGARA